MSVLAAITPVRRKYQEAQQECLRQAREADQNAQAATKHQAAMQRYEAHAKQCRSEAADHLAQVLQKASSRTAPPEHVLRFPHCTGLRPAVLLTHEAPQVPFLEQLFVRSLAATLQAHVQYSDAPWQDLPAAASWGARGRLQTAAANEGAIDVLFFAPLQPRTHTHDPGVARLEALSACALAVVVLSDGLINSPAWPREQQQISARLMNPSAPFTLLVLRYSDDPLLAPPSFQLPPASPEVAPGHHQNVFQVVMPCKAAPGEKVLAALKAARGPLAALGVVLPEGEMEVFHEPSRAVQAAQHRLGSPSRTSLLSLSMGATAGRPGSGTLGGPLVGSLEPGAAWVVAHALPAHPHALGLAKRLQQWTVQDVQVWLISLGASIARLADPFRRLGVDGALLTCVGAPELYGPLGLGPADPSAISLLKAITRLQESDKRMANLPASGGGAQPDSTFNLPLGVDEPLLFSMSTAELHQSLLDVVQYYDVDCSGDLVANELGTLLLGCGLHLSDTEVATVLSEYDIDCDGKLNSEEALSLLWEVWRLLVASRDATAWNVPWRPDLARIGRLHAPEVHPATSPRPNNSSNPTTPRQTQTTSGAALTLSASQQERLAASGRLSHLNSAADRSRKFGSLSSTHALGSISASKNSSRAPSPVESGNQEQHRIGSLQHRTSHTTFSVVQSEPGSKRESTSNVPVATWPHGVVMGVDPAPADLAAAQNHMRAGRVSFAAAGRHAEAHQVGSTSVGRAARALTAVGSTSPTRRTNAAGAISLTASALAAAAGGTRSHAGLGSSSPWTGAGGKQVKRSDAGSTHGSTVATDLDVFADPAVMCTTTLRATSELSELECVLRGALQAADFRRVGALDAWELRRALAAALAAETALAGAGAGVAAEAAKHTGRSSGTPLARSLSLCGPLVWAGDTQGEWAAGGAEEEAESGRRPLALSPAELRLLVGPVLSQCEQNAAECAAVAELEANGTGTSSISSIPVESFLTAALEAVVVSQNALLDAVYAPVGGMQQLLYKLHAQVYPHSASSVGVYEVLKPRGSVKVGTSTANSTISNFKIPFDEAPALLQIVAERVGMKPTLLVRTAILQESAAAAERVAGSGQEVAAWACMLAHMLHVWQQLGETS